MSPNDTLELSPHDHEIKISIVILNSFCFRFTSFTSGIGNHFPLLLSSSFHPSFTSGSIFQANAGGTLANNWVNLSGRLMRSQYVRLPPCWCCCCSDECPIVGAAGQRAVAAVVVFLLRHLPHLVPPTPAPEGRG